MKTRTKVHLLVALPYVWVLVTLIVGLLFYHWKYEDFVGAGLFASIVHAFLQTLIAVDHNI